MCSTTCIKRSRFETKLSNRPYEQTGIKPLPSISITAAKSSTLPHQRPPSMPSASSSGRDRERDRERDGYYSDRNELIRERERERERDRGYLSDHNSR